MSIISGYSMQHLIKEGRHEGARCVVQGYFFKGMSVPTFASVLLIDLDGVTATVMEKDLAGIFPPGLPLTEMEHKKCLQYSYDLEEYFRRQKLVGSNLLRCDDIAQPRTLRVGDVLATGEIVEKLRKGCNGCVLVYLEHSEWVELNPALPIALLSNSNSRLPLRLAANDKLATGFLVRKDATSSEVNWVDVLLDQYPKCFKIPACVPLALA